MTPHLRIARPTDRLVEVCAMYREGLGLTELGSFTDHDGFDGAMLGRPGAGWHLEFTREHGVEVGRAPTADNLLVLYHPDEDGWHAACQRAVAAGFIQVASHNPYWDRCGHTFEDPDGYRVVLQRGAWPTMPAG